MMKTTLAELRSIIRESIWDMMVGKKKEATPPENPDRPAMKVINAHPREGWGDGTVVVDIESVVKSGRFSTYKVYYKVRGTDKVKTMFPAEFVDRFNPPE